MFGWAPTDYSPMVDFDLRTLGRNILLIAGILSCLAIAEMILAAGEKPEPDASPSQQASLLTAPSR